GSTTWMFGDGLQSVKSSPQENPAVWQVRGEALDTAAAAVVAAHQDLERAGRRAATAKPVGEGIAMGVAVVAISGPAFGLWTGERQRSTGLTRRLTASEHSRDSLTGVITKLREAAVSKPIDTSESIKQARIRALGNLIAQGDSIKTKCLNGPYRPIDDA